MGLCTKNPLLVESKQGNALLLKGRQVIGIFNYLIFIEYALIPPLGT